MTTLQNNLSKAIEMIIENKLEFYENDFAEKIASLERQINISSTNPGKEILMQKEYYL